MPRFARVHYPTGIYHLVSRTFNREFLIEDDIAREYYLNLLAESLKKTDTSLLAWCLMSNHVHLVVRAGMMPLERLMKGVHSGFAVWLNNRLGGRKGAVFADRYKSILVEEETYLLQLVRYVHNNPVRAGLVARAEESTWSSHQAYLGNVETPQWLNVGWVLSMLNEDAEVGRKLFADYVFEGRGEKRREDLNGRDSSGVARRFQKELGDGWRLSGPIVGSDRFAAKVLEDLKEIDSGPARAFAVGDVDARADDRPSLDELIGVTCAVVGVEPWEFEQQPKRRLCAKARKVIVWLWVNRYGGKQIELVRKLNASTGAVSRWYSRAVMGFSELEAVVDEVADRLPSLLHGKDEPTTIRYNLKYEA